MWTIASNVCKQINREWVLIYGRRSGDVPSLEFSSGTLFLASVTGAKATMRLGYCKQGNCSSNQPN
jgi:hypothetical protein